MRTQRTYGLAERLAAVQRTLEVGPAAASGELGIPGIPGWGRARSATSFGARESGWR